MKLQKITNIFRHFVLFCIASFLSLILGAVLLNNIIMPHFLQTGIEIETPEITEKKVDEARTILSRAGLELYVEDIMPHPTYPAGVIITQRPEFGMNVKKGRKIHVIVSKGVPRVQVPSLVEKSHREALNLLKAKNLRVGDERRVPSMEFPYPDIVIRQDPLPETFVPENEQVHLWISSGKKDIEVYMPYLIGMDLSLAHDSLSVLGFEKFEIQNEESSEHLPNTILDQAPLPGEFVTISTEIILVVSELERKKDNENKE